MPPNPTLKFGLGAMKNMRNGINLELIQKNLVAIEATVFMRTTVWLYYAGSRDGGIWSTVFDNNGNKSWRRFFGLGDWSVASFCVGQ
jgi:hypothetical protein